MSVNQSIILIICYSKAICNIYYVVIKKALDLASFRKTNKNIKF